MNNEERNTYVRTQITKALLALLESKSLNNISIRELTDRAGVGRVSFYRNFVDKEDVLRQESRRLLRQWGDFFESKPDTTYPGFFLSMFDFYQKNASFYKTVYQAGLSGLMLDTFVATADITPQTPNLEAYLKSFWAYGIFGWVSEWVSRGMRESGEELYALFQQMNPGGP